MFTFFTDPYPDEILYSTIARYHYYSGNVSFKNTLYEIFGKDTSLPTMELPCKLEYFASQFRSKAVYSSDYFINNHTILPFYIPFLPADRSKEIEYEMKYSDGKAIQTKIGLVAGSICHKRSLVYCPICARSDVFTYGEAYFHRVHQLQGVFLCPEHDCYLNNYNISKKDTSRIEFIRLEEKFLDFEICYEPNEKISEVLLKVARACKYILINNLKSFNQDRVREKYLNILSNKELITENNTIKQRELSEEFLNYFDTEMLKILQSDFDPYCESNWLKMLLRKPRKAIHPIRNILFILFLSGNADIFFETDSEHGEPFGKGPWPCLNPVVSHYKENVISNCDITADYKTRKPIGTFNCECGFVYSRKGPDKADEDKYRIGRIKDFGIIWENSLRDHLCQKDKSIRELARLMCCDPNTIIKYSQKLGLGNCINSSVDYSEILIKKINTNPIVNIYEYKEDIKSVIKANPEYSRQQVRNETRKQYAYLFKHDKCWLDQNLPNSIARGKRNNNNKQIVNWEKRDLELKDRICTVYNELISNIDHIRINKSILGKKTGSTALLDYCIDKLPETKKYLSSIVESIEDFQIRRVNNACKEILKSNRTLKKWEIVRKAGLRPNYSRKVDDAINQNIKLCIGERDSDV